MLKQRLISGITMAVILVSSLLYLPGPGLLILLLFAATAALLEYYRMLEHGGLPSSPAMGVLGGLCLIAGTWYAGKTGLWDASDMIWLVILFFTLGSYLRQFPEKKNKRPVETISNTIMGFLYIPFLLNFFTKLLVSDDWSLDTGRWLVLYLLFVVKFSDIGAYFIGCAFGRHKMAPHLSPAKSWEGFFGGVGASMIVSVVFFNLAHAQFGTLAFTLLDAVILGLLLSVAGIQGDLAESLFKRGVGTKDSSALIKGMGGILDVIDSPLFGAPILYVYARLFL